MVDADPQAGPPRRGERAGLVLVVLGLIGIVWGVLYVSDRAYGEARPGRTFAERHSYDMVKTSVHESFPGLLLRAGGGLVLLLVGARLRRGPTP